MGNNEDGVSWTGGIRIAKDKRHFYLCIYIANSYIFSNHFILTTMLSVCRTVSYTHLDVYKRQVRICHTSGLPYRYREPARTHRRARALNEFISNYFQ